jgi:hypothetical protein
MAMNLSEKSLEYPIWQRQCLRAITEGDPERLKIKIALAEDAMFRRGADLKTDGDGPERFAMRQAARQLRALMLSVLGYPRMPGESHDGI